MVTQDIQIIDFLYKDLKERPFAGKKDPFWTSLKGTGTTLWLDTGDIEEAEANWSVEMSALTTNNTLLNNEIQKGIYDNFIEDAKPFVKGLSEDEKIKEIAFMLNARHGLRLAQKFGGMVSVELHTDTAYDLKAIENYGKRFHEISPEHFIVKVPYTSTGLLGARILKDQGIKINLTLGFSARENILVTGIARPDYCNVFLGRIGAFIINNKLGDGSGAGEMAVLSSQKWVSKLSKLNEWPTRVIAASLRNFEQIESLAGTDVFTMPPKVASAGRKNLKGSFISRINENYKVGLSPAGETAHIEKFWEVDDKILALAEKLSTKIPRSGDELIGIVHDNGCGDMFPVLSQDEEIRIASDGKIPVYSHWEKAIKENITAPDTLLSLAGLASFASDQSMLDKRIRSIIG